VQVLAHVGEKPLNSLLSDPDDFFSPHGDGGHFLMGDGSVRYIRQTIRLQVLRTLATRNGGEIIENERR
jgi:prepilin-type processing-associated H-X9-DG protein